MHGRGKVRLAREVDLEDDVVIDWFPWCAPNFLDILRSARHRQWANQLRTPGDLDFFSLSLFPPHPRATDSRKNLVNSCASNRSVAEEGWCSRTIHKFAIVSRSIRGILFWREPPGAARGFPRFFEFRARKLRSYANHGPQIRDSQIVSSSSNARLTFNVT